MPSEIPISAVLDARFRLPCPCSIFTNVHPLNSEGEEVARTTPFFRVTQKQGSWYPFLNEGMFVVPICSCLSSSSQGESLVSNPVFHSLPLALTQLLRLHVSFFVRDCGF